MAYRVMVLGMGNILKGDDGLGFYAIRDLAREEWPDQVCFLHRAQWKEGGVDVEGYTGLLLIDTLENGQQPGTIYTYGHLELLQNKSCLRWHPLLEAMTVAPLLGHSLQTGFVGMEPASRDYTLCLTSSVAQAYEQFLDAVRSRLRFMLNDKQSYPEVSNKDLLQSAHID